MIDKFESALWTMPKRASHLEFEFNLNLHQPPSGIKHDRSRSQDYARRIVYVSYDT